MHSVRLALIHDGDDAGQVREISGRYGSQKVTKKSEAARNRSLRSAPKQNPEYHEESSAHCITYVITVVMQFAPDASELLSARVIRLKGG